MVRNLFLFLLCGAMLCLLFTSCKKDQLLTDSSVSLQFSTDTVQFDTVFTTIGSATQVFIVTNTFDQPISISSVYLATGGNSYFRLNVNGTPGKSFKDVEIGANDSIWIFAEVTLDPNNQNTPFIVTDSVIFVTNGYVQNVKLVAYGQDAHFHPSGNETDSLHKSKCTSIFKLADSVPSNKNLHWTNDKPHVIYGYAILDAGYTLTIDSGANIYFHNSSGLIVLNSAKIIVNGTLNKPVTFQGDRLGYQFADVPGQWDRILLSNISAIDLTQCPIPVTGGQGPSGNVFKYAIIKNGYVGIEADTVAAPNTPAVVLDNTIFENFASTALYGAGSNIQANNCVFANCGEYCIALSYGGDYRFLHCTIANYWSQTSTGQRKTPALYMNNYYDVVRPLNNAYFGNCIIWGDLDNEIGLDSATVANAFNFVFDHTVIKMDDKTFSGGSSAHYISVKRNIDPLFQDPANNIFLVDSATSVVIDLGDPVILTKNPVPLSTDLRGRVRPQGAAPDMGAYEMR